MELEENRTFADSVGMKFGRESALQSGQLRFGTSGLCIAAEVLLTRIAVAAIMPPFADSFESHRFDEIGVGVPTGSFPG